MTIAVSHIQRQPALAATPAGYLARSSSIALLFCVPVLICAASWIMGGLGPLTDLGFLILTVLCTWFLALEFYHFPRRFGVGGMVLFGGVLVWFCHDYLTRWFGIDFRSPDVPYSAEMIARVAFLHTLLIAGMTVGLLINQGRWLENVFHAIPEPTSRKFYFFIVLFLFALGMIPYVFFTSGSNTIFEVFYYEITGGRGRGVGFTTGRSGNLNYNWGGYIVELMHQGQFGAIFAAFYAILIARHLWEKVICWAIWALWLGLAFGSGTRGQVLFICMPVVILLYIKHQAHAAALLKRVSKRAYLYAAVVLFLMFYLIQYQGQFRNVTFRFADTSRLDLTELSGNAMFSEGLRGFEVIPSQQGFFANRFPGEGALRAIPETAFWFAIGPIPRALWNSKPIDPVWDWFNELTVGTVAGQGTTVSKGLVGSWYFRYGILGLVEGAILMGWLMRVSERALQNARGRPFSILFSLAVLTFLFRQYRDINFNELYVVLIGFVLLFFMVHLQRTFSR